MGHDLETADSVSIDACAIWIEEMARGGPGPHAESMGLVGRSRFGRRAGRAHHLPGAKPSHRLHPGRDRHRQGADRAGPPQHRVRGASGPSSRTTSRRFPTRSSRASSLGTRGERSPAPTPIGRVSSNWRTAGRCSWTRSATRARRCRVDCFACFRRGRFAASARAGPGASTCAWSRRPTGTWRWRCGPGGFVPTSSTGSTS